MRLWKHADGPIACVDWRCGDVSQSASLAYWAMVRVNQLLIQNPAHQKKAISLG
jgi:hypothetical protein